MQDITCVQYLIKSLKTYLKYCCSQADLHCLNLTDEMPVINLAKHLAYICVFCAVGKVVLLNDHEVCKEGDILTPEQARILVSFRKDKDDPMMQTSGCSQCMVGVIKEQQPNIKLNSNFCFIFRSCWVIQWQSFVLVLCVFGQMMELLKTLHSFVGLRRCTFLPIINYWLIMICRLKSMYWLM